MRMSIFIVTVVGVLGIAGFLAYNAFFYYSEKMEQDKSKD